MSLEKGVDLCVGFEIYGTEDIAFLRYIAQDITTNNSVAAVLFVVYNTLYLVQVRYRPGDTNIVCWFSTCLTPGR
jgi:hypothetical protein